MDGKLTLTDDTVHQSVMRAWTETLPRAPYGPTIEWADAGADSLDTLHLVLRLETYLDRKVSLDLITPDMTAWSLTQQLLKEPAAHKNNERSPVFLVPPFFGDEPIFADFRRSLSQHVWLQTLDLPDLGCPASLLSDMAATGHFVATEIARRLPQGDILLAGYSFGGCVAFEAAACLLAQGRQVVFLGLLDPVAPIRVDEEGVHSTKRPARSWRQRLLHWKMMFENHEDKDMFGYIDWLLFAAFAKMKAFDHGRRRILSARHRLSPEGFVRRRKHLLGILRVSALQRWRPLPLNAPTLLVMSETSIAFGSSHLWKRFCSKLDVVRLPGQHCEIFKPQALELLVPAFVEAVKAAGVGEC